MCRRTWLHLLLPGLHTLLMALQHRRQYLPLYSLRCSLRYNLRYNLLYQQQQQQVALLSPPVCCSSCTRRLQAQAGCLGDLRWVQVLNDCYDCYVAT
jgi:hypothetical protein